MAAIVFLAFCNPAASPWLVAFGALLVATASATQDIVIDAFRVESLEPSEQAAGMASYVATYRIGMVVSGAGALYIVEGFERSGFGLQTAWTFGYLAMAVFVLVGIVTAIFATEPRNAGAGVTRRRQSAQARVRGGRCRVQGFPRSRPRRWSSSSSSSSTSSAMRSPAP